MEGLVYNFCDQRGVSVDTGSTVFDLLAKQGSVEVMHLTLKKSDTIWLCPADDDSVMEFFFLHSGGLEISLDEGPLKLKTGDSFYLNALRHDVPVRAVAETELIYVTNSPMLASSQEFEASLRKLLMQINEKDHYTYRHSGDVVHYVRELYDSFRAECGKVSLDELLVAALFHDVGKCYVPDEILKKREKLEPEEIRLILRHPRDSARLLRPYFGERVAEIAANHHERLDGSGYPNGFTSDEVSFASRLLAVADVFDAMTTDRGYNRIKSDLEAAEELFALDQQYDRRITERLLTLVREGKLEKPMGGNDEPAG